MTRRDPQPRAAEMLETIVSEAQIAAQSGIRELLARHEAKVIAKLVTAYRTGALSPEDAKTGIGIIAEMRTLGGDVERTINRANGAL